MSQRRPWRRTAAPRAGQTMVMTGLILTVFFGMLALVVDLGFLMVQRRIQQNAADAAALGVAKLLASSVGIDSSGGIHFVDQSDATVMSLAQSLAAGNWPGLGVSRTITIEYLDCAGQPLRTATPGLGAEVPQQTCAVRATGASTTPSFFIRVLDPARSALSATARATARIAPTAPPSRRTGLWPITRWKNYPGSTPCWYSFTVPCVFWSNNGGAEDTSIGDWKEKVYLSRYSQFTCPRSVPQLLAAFDPAREGSPCGSSQDTQQDMEYWFRYGFNGVIATGDRPEIHPGGVIGTNFANAMHAYINANPEGVHPAWGNYRTVTVSLWEQAEAWDSKSNSWKPWKPPSTSHPPDRVIISDLRCFRFYDNQVDSSEVRGHYVSCYETTPPQSGPPSGLANTVQLID